MAVLMSLNKMHVDEFDINIQFVSKLLNNQFPQWANSKLKTVQPEGTGNVMYKLGKDKGLLYYPYTCHF